MSTPHEQYYDQDRWFTRWTESHLWGVEYEYEEEDDERS